MSPTNRIVAGALRESAIRRQGSLKTRRVSDVRAAKDGEGTVRDPTVRERLVQPVVVPRWVQLVMLPLGVLGLWALARAAGRVLLVFLIAAVIALILNPLVSLLQRRLRLRRGLAVAAVYLGFFTALGGIGVLLANPVSDQVAAFQKDVPRAGRRRQQRSRQRPAVARRQEHQRPDQGSGLDRARDPAARTSCAARATC